MCNGEKLAEINVLGRIIKSFGNLLHKIKIDYREQTDEDQWEEITKALKY